LTTVLLPPEPVEVPPIDVDPDAIRRCGSELLVASAQVDDLGTFAAGDARIGDWTGAASTAYHHGLRPLGHRADAMSLALRGVAQRVDAHADEMASLKDRRVGLVDWRLHLVRHLADLRRRIDAATEDEAAALQAEADALGREIGHFDTDVTSWSSDVGTEEQAMSLAFSRVLTLEQVEAAYGGAADPADAALATKPAAGASPDAVHAWWVGLTEAQRQALIAAAPRSIGNLDGIPAGARDAANRVSLGRDLAQLEAYDAAGDLSGHEQDLLRNARAAYGALERIEDGVDPVTGDPIEAQVYLYDPGAFEGDGAVAISAGDLDTADNTSLVVPGFGTDGASAGYQAERAIRLYEASRSLETTETNATLFYIGYDAPDNLPTDGLDAAGVITEDMAEAGGEHVADALDGLRAMRPDNPTHLTAIGHSYGSTTLGHAAHDEGIPVDDIVVVGSPGLGGDTDHADDLGIDPDHVYAGANSRDPVTYLGNHGWFNLETFGGLGLGDDPAEDDFGANRFEAEDPSRPGYPDFGQHSLYFDHDTESLYNIASVVNGDYADVLLAEHNYDPWWGGVQDPELDRDPTTTDTLVDR
jgi:hypothetical protein